jgi:hypothetical protein
MAVKALSDKQIKEVCSAYENGATSTALAKKYKVNDETIRRWLKISGVKMRASRDSLAAPVNSEYFDIIDSEDKAYWLGYLVADACIGESVGTRRSLRFYLAKKDESAIEQFAKDISYKGKLRDVRSRNQKGICFNNPRLCSSLIDKGYLDWKETGSARLIDSLDSTLIRHFIRGFFDGDGSVSFQTRKRRKKPAYSFCMVADKNHHEALDRIRSIISEEVSLPPKDVKVRNTCIFIGWNGNNQVERFAKWLYKDATRYLLRKKAIFDSLLNYGKEFDLADIIIKPVPIDQYVKFFNSYHYLGAGGRRGYTIGAYLNDQLIAAATIGSITRAEMAKKQGLVPKEARELARLCIHPDHHKKNLPTWFLSRVIKRYKYEYPDIKLIISFADTTQGHEGTIYKAANWKYDGKTGRSYHYVDSAGTIIHKKTVYGIAKKNKQKEAEYVKLAGLEKVRHLPKKRFLLWV